MAGDATHGADALPRLVAAVAASLVLAFGAPCMDAVAAGGRKTPPVDLSDPKRCDLAALDKFAGGLAAAPPPCDGVGVCGGSALQPPGASVHCPLPADTRAAFSAEASGGNMVEANVDVRQCSFSGKASAAPQGGPGTLGPGVACRCGLRALVWRSCMPPHREGPAGRGARHARAVPAPHRSPWAAQQPTSLLVLAAPLLQDLSKKVLSGVLMQDADFSGVRAVGIQVSRRRAGQRGLPAGGLPSEQPPQAGAAGAGAGGRLSRGRAGERLSRGRGRRAAQQGQGQVGGSAAAVLALAWRPHPSHPPLITPTPHPSQPSTPHAHAACSLRVPTRGAPTCATWTPPTPTATAQTLLAQTCAAPPLTTPSSRAPSLVGTLRAATGPTWRGRGGWRGAGACSADGGTQQLLALIALRALAAGLRAPCSAAATLGASARIQVSGELLPGAAPAAGACRSPGRVLLLQVHAPATTHLPLPAPQH